jgi:hypothetical protein
MLSLARHGKEEDIRMLLVSNALLSAARAVSVGGGPVAALRGAGSLPPAGPRVRPVQDIRRDPDKYGLAWPGPPA